VIRRRPFFLKSEEFAMFHMRLITTLAFGLVLAGCAGTPPGGTKTASAKHCARTTGSMLCSNPDDMPLGDSSSPAAQTQFQGKRGN